VSDPGSTARTDQVLAGLADPKLREDDWVAGSEPVIERLAGNLAAEFDGDIALAGRVLVAAGCELSTILGRREQVTGTPTCPAVSGVLNLMALAGERLVHPRPDS
jgi:hypothetical protein